VAGHHKNFGRLLLLSQLAKYFEAAAPRHHYIEQRDIEFSLARGPDGRVRVVNQRDLMAEPG
jgi:hypothetical protein